MPKEGSYLETLLERYDDFLKVSYNPKDILRKVASALATFIPSRYASYATCKILTRSSPPVEFLLAFVGKESIREDSFPIGVEQYTGLPIFISPEITMNFHFGVFGRSGSGKTTFVVNLIASAVLFHVIWRGGVLPRLILLDTENEYPYRLSFLRSEFGIEYNTYSIGLDYAVDLLDSVYSTSLEARIKSNEEVLLSLFRRLGPRQVGVLRRGLRETYSSMGINDDASLMEAVRKEKLPNVLDLAEKLSQLASSESLSSEDKTRADILASLLEGFAKAVGLERRRRVLRLSKLMRPNVGRGIHILVLKSPTITEEVRLLLLEWTARTILDYASQKGKTPSPEMTILVNDEAHRSASSAKILGGSEVGAEESSLVKLIRMGRGYNLFCINISQYTTDLPEQVTKMSGINIVFNHPADALRKSFSEFEIPRSVLSEIADLPQHTFYARVLYSVPETGQSFTSWFKGRTLFLSSKCDLAVEIPKIGNFAQQEYESLANELRRKLA